MKMVGTMRREYILKNILDELFPIKKTFAFKTELEGLKETRRELKKVETIEQLEKAANADEIRTKKDLFKFK